MHFSAATEFIIMSYVFGLVDLSQPAATAREAVQFLYMAYLAGIKDKPEIAAKTGTAQTFYNNVETETLSAISYAPANMLELFDMLDRPQACGEEVKKLMLERGADEVENERTYR